MFTVGDLPASCKAKSVVAKCECPGPPVDVLKHVVFLGTWASIQTRLLLLGHSETHTHPLLKPF